MAFCFCVAMRFHPKIASCVSFAHLFVCSRSICKVLSDKNGNCQLFIKIEFSNISLAFLSLLNHHKVSLQKINFYCYRLFLFRMMLISPWNKILVSCVMIREMKIISIENRTEKAMKLSCQFHLLHIKKCFRRNILLCKIVWNINVKIM